MAAAHSLLKEESQFIMLGLHCSAHYALFTLPDLVCPAHITARIQKQGFSAEMSEFTITVRRIPLPKRGQ